MAHFGQIHCTVNIAFIARRVKSILKRWKESPYPRPATLRGLRNMWGITKALGEDAKICEPACLCATR
jgi:hypothetical protein